MIVELSERQLQDLTNGEELIFKQGPVHVVIRRLPVMEDDEALG